MFYIPQSQRTMRDKTHRLLELLLKRGPEAFSKFIVILREDYLWLAERLEESYTARLEEEEIRMYFTFYFLTFTILGKIFSRQHFEIFFIIFPRKQDFFI